jgi:hypothetical protein
MLHLQYRRQYRAVPDEVENGWVSLKSLRPNQGSQEVGLTHADFPLLILHENGVGPVGLHLAVVIRHEQVTQTVG